MRPGSLVVISYLVQLCVVGGLSPILGGGPRRIVSLRAHATREPSRAEQKFRSMIERFSEYSEEELNTVRSPRLRELFRGVRVGAVTPEVVQAFAILYSDYRLIRGAGDLIFKTLDGNIQRSIA